MHALAVRARQQAVLGGGRPLRRQQTLLPPPVGHGEDGGHVGVVEVGVGGDGGGVAVGDDVRLRGAAVVVVVVGLHGRRAAFPSSSTAAVVTPPLRVGRFGRDPADEGQDLQGALGDGGQLGAALLVAGDVVDVVAEEAAVALQRQREAVMEEEEEDDDGTGNALASRGQLHTRVHASNGDNKGHKTALKLLFPLQNYVVKQWQYFCFIFTHFNFLSK